MAFLDLASQLADGGIDALGRDLRTDRMGKQGMQAFAMFVVHQNSLLDLRTFSPPGTIFPLIQVSDVLRLPLVRLIWSRCH